MKRRRYLLTAVIVTLSLFGVGAMAAKGNKWGEFAQKSTMIQIQQVSPASTNLDLPSGPRTGQFYLTGSTSAFSNGVHDLGLIKKGQKITVFVEGLTTGFDPIVLLIAPNWAKSDVLVWEADDNGSDPDPAFTVTAPVSGVYTMLVAEYTARSG